MRPDAIGCQYRPVGFIGALSVHLMANFATKLMHINQIDKLAISSVKKGGLYRAEKGVMTNFQPRQLGERGDLSLIHIY